MGNTANGMDRMIRLTGRTDLCAGFVNEWLDPTVDTVQAHTSGSTGEPKPVRLLKSDMTVSARATCEFFGINGHSRMLLPLSTDYIAGKMMVVRSFVAGAELIVEQPSSAPLPCDYGPIDLMAVVPSQLPSLITNPRFTSVRNLIVGGGAISTEMEQKLRKMPVNAYATYGMTETCSHVALRNVSAGQEHYEALPHVTFSQESDGVLAIHCSGMSGGALVTTDVVELLSPTSFRWLGRRDNVINSGGIKIHPEQVETLLSPLLNGTPFYLIGRPSERWGEEMVMYVEGDIDRDCFIESVHRILPRYNTPKEIIAVNRFERTSSGKIKRKLL